MLQTIKTGCIHDPLPASETLYAVYRSPVYARDYQNRPWSHPLSVAFINIFYRNIPEFKCQALRRISRNVTIHSSEAGRNDSCTHNT